MRHLTGDFSFVCGSKREKSGQENDWNRVFKKAIKQFVNQKRE